MTERPPAKPKSEKPKAPKPEALKAAVSHKGRLYGAGTPTSKLDPPLSDEQRARLKRLGVL